MAKRAPAKTLDQGSKVRVGQITMTVHQVEKVSGNRVRITWVREGERRSSAFVCHEDELYILV